MDRRTWIFALVGALLGAAVGLFYVLTFNVLCACETMDGRCSCNYALAVPIWTAIGVVAGGVLGLAIHRVTRPR
jgi:hypothetical protein